MKTNIVWIASVIFSLGFAAEVFANKGARSTALTTTSRTTGKAKALDTQLKGKSKALEKKGEAVKAASERRGAAAVSAAKSAKSLPVEVRSVLRKGASKTGKNYEEVEITVSEARSMAEDAVESIVEKTPDSQFREEDLDQVEHDLQEVLENGESGPIAVFTAIARRTAEKMEKESAVENTTIRTEYEEALREGLPAERLAEWERSCRLAI